jgi:hypothetical protein
MRGDVCQIACDEDEMWSSIGRGSLADMVLYQKVVITLFRSIFVRLL